jgi:putative transposase
MHRRHRPAHGVHIEAGHATIAFLTVCTQTRQPWLATESNHRLLVEVWSIACAWIVGRYVIMPDQLHLFAAPGKLELPLEN